MNLSRAIALFVVFVTCAAASAFKDTELGKAIDNGQFSKAKRLWRRNALLHKKAIEHVVGTNDAEFIIKFIKRVNPSKGFLLTTLLSKAGEDVIGVVEGEVRFSEESWTNALSQPESVCQPERLVARLKKLSDPVRRDNIVVRGVWKLVEGDHTDCIDPLLDAFQGDESVGEFRDVIVREAFKAGLEKGKDFWVRAFYRDPAITSTVYARELFDLGQWGIQDPLFKSFLKAASHNDLLEALKLDYSTASNGEKLRAVIGEAARNTQSKEKRSDAFGERATVVKKTLTEQKDPSPLPLPGALGDMIASYVTEE